MATRVLDVHAHITPASALRAMQSGENWFGISAPALYNQHRYNPRTFWTPEQRLADMQSLGVDTHVLSTNANMYFYDLDAEQTLSMHQECNDYVAQLAREHPDRFAGLAHLPMQDVGAAIEELTRAVEQLGLKGAMIGDHINGRTFDDPVFSPLWATAERLGAMFLIHQGGDTVVSPALEPLPSAQHHRQPGRPGRYLRLLRLRRRDGPLPRPENLPVPRRGLRLLRHRAYGPGLAGAPRSAGQHQPPAQRLLEPLLLRLPHPQRGRAADAHRPGRH